MIILYYSALFKFFLMLTFSMLVLDILAIHIKCVMLP